MPGDGLAFEQSVTVHRITLESKYPGIRAKLRGTLSGARFALQLDIGIHDAAVPTPGWVDFPTLLGDPAPRIRAYHPSTAIAEKLHAIVNLGTANSRMKDFFDIWMLATTQTFAGRDLRDAVAATFARRETPLPNETPVGLSDAFVDQEHTYRMWASFASRMTASGIHAPDDLREVLAVIRNLVMRPIHAAISNEVLEAEWAPGVGWR